MQDEIPVEVIPKRKSRTAWQQLTQSKLMVLATLFAVTGALGLPVLWLSPAFRSWEKGLYSIVVTVYTIALLWGTYAICMWAWNRIQGAY